MTRIERWEVTRRHGTGATGASRGASDAADLAPSGDEVELPGSGAAQHRCQQHGDVQIRIHCEVFVSEEDSAFRKTRRYGVRSARFPLYVGIVCFVNRGQAS